MKKIKLTESQFRRLLLKEENEGVGKMSRLKNMRYSPIRHFATWDDENREFIWKPSTDPEVMEWITKEVKRDIKPLLAPIGVGKLQIVGFEFPFYDKPVNSELFSQVDVQNVNTKEELASLHSERLVDGFINMMYDDYELTDELSIIEQYKKLALFCKVMADHHKQDHFWKH